MKSVSEVTLANAGSSEECSAISEELVVRVTEMTIQIKMFNLFA